VKLAGKNGVGSAPEFKVPLLDLLIMQHHFLRLMCHARPHIKPCIMERGTASQPSLNVKQQAKHH